MLELSETDTIVQQQEWLIGNEGNTTYRPMTIASDHRITTMSLSPRVSGTHFARQFGLAACITVLLTAPSATAFGQEEAPTTPLPTDPSDVDTYVAVPDPRPIRKFAFQRFYTKDKYQRLITFYLSKPKHRESSPASGETKPEKRLPLAICIQGSGSQSIFLRYQGLIASGGPESVLLRDFGEQVRVLVVEKPGVEFLVQPSRPGSAEDGPEEFNREFTLQRWVEAINAAAEAASRLPEIDCDQVLALGHSEGAQVACTLAAVNPRITHVAAMAGGGPTQLHDLIQFARRGDMYDPNQTPKQRVEALLADWKKVMDAPRAHDQFILGHSHLRWSTFCAVSPIDALKRTRARVFVAQGTADTNSLPESAEMLYAELLARGRDVTYHRVENGDHAFMTPDDSTGQGWTRTVGKAVEWFLADAANKP